MNKDLELILNKLSNDIDINNKMQRVDSVFYHLFDQLSSNDEKVLKIYGKYKINDIVSLIKIERLFDLGIISDEEKKILTKVEKRKEAFRAVKFTLFSISAGVIEFVSFTLLTLIPALNPSINKSIYWIPALISLVLSVLWNFTFNRKFTFQSATNVPIAMIKTLAYYIVFAPLSIWLAQMYLIDQLGWNEFGVKAIVMITNFITEFLYQRFFVFGKSIDTNVKNNENSQKSE